MMTALVILVHACLLHGAPIEQAPSANDTEATGEAPLNQAQASRAQELASIEPGFQSQCKQTRLHI